MGINQKEGDNRPTAPSIAGIGFHNSVIRAQGKYTKEESYWIGTSFLRVPNMESGQC